MSPISIIILTHNKLAVTRRCLPRLLQSADAGWELIVVDNGSTDGTTAWLRGFQGEAERAGLRMRVLANAANAGCSTARNQGIAAATGDRIVFVDNDVTVRSRNWLGRLSRLLDVDPAIGMVGPKLVYPVAPYRIQFAGGAVSRTGRVQFLGRGAAIDDSRFNVRREVQYLISACCMTRRSVLEQAGGFDEAFNPVQFEDTDLCYRIREKGYRILFEPAVEMYHYESSTTAGTAALPNTALVVRHGLLFKQRWMRMIEKEDGPPDSAIAWHPIPLPSLETIPEPPIISAPAVSRLDSRGGAVYSHFKRGE